MDLRPATSATGAVARRFPRLSSSSARRSPKVPPVSRPWRRRSSRPVGRIRGPMLPLCRALLCGDERSAAHRAAPEFGAGGGGSGGPGSAVGHAVGCCPGPRAAGRGVDLVESSNAVRGVGESRRRCLPGYGRGADPTGDDCCRPDQSDRFRSGSAGGHVGLRPGHGCRGHRPQPATGRRRRGVQSPAQIPACIAAARSRFAAGLRC